MPLDLGDIGPADIRATRAPPGTYSFTTQELSYPPSNRSSSEAPSEEPVAPAPEMPSTPQALPRAAALPGTPQGSGTPQLAAPFGGINLNSPSENPATTARRRRFGALLGESPKKKHTFFEELAQREALPCGIDIPGQAQNPGVKAAIPSHLVRDMKDRIVRYNQIRQDISSTARARLAMREVMSGPVGEGVLFDLTSDDEEYIRRILETQQSNMSLILRKNSRAFPKAFRDWDPKKTEAGTSSNGLRVILKDKQNRALFKVTIGDFEETHARKIMFGETTAGHVPPPSPMKRKTADVQHKDRADMATSEDSFKRPKIVGKFSIEVKRAPSAEQAITESLDTKIYDNHKIRGVPGGFEVAVNYGNFGGHPMGLPGMKLAVPSDLAKFLNDKAQGAANNTRLGGSPYDRAMKAVREFMSEEFKEFSGPCALINMTTEEESRFLRAYDGEDYASVASAIRGRPSSFLSLSLFKDWDPTATVIERHPDGEVTVLFQDYFNRKLMGVWIRG
ncbi:hypothetical protein PFICI_14022 [Pestalotiopsis fici W106-1]|uniref:Uncharacterized protein n=1 Tax=Pestalotiopsis fici (strain W106-1 / CGMCC3.15140) TaxID=1229662 RepID=W3WMW0_PESFW|nr:uncharacterized protein PFICI_14022 [Pestalotiopsis fici W106-1]ETS74156.1 hypothetical protein PFICI_14022 [Pestalotiopsis fici W106-1]